MFETFTQLTYTGSNRCIPCTVLNITIVLVLAGLIQQVSRVLAVAAVVVGLLVIYLRGYLIPGTPMLTRRIFPDRLLSWFGKQPTGDDSGMTGTDVESVLIDAAALEPCEAGTDLCLAAEFRRTWRRELRKLPPIASFPIETLVGMQWASDANIEDRGSAVVLSVGDRSVGWWPSRAAYRADAAAAICLSERYYGWRDLDFRDRTAVLAGLRLWLEYCPDCNGPLELGESVVESCCTSQNVVALTCTDCNARLLEAPQSD